MTAGHDTNYTLLAVCRADSKDKTQLLEVSMKQCLRSMLSPRQVCEEVLKRMKPEADAIFGTNKGVQKAAGVADIRRLARATRDEVVVQAEAWVP